MFKIIRLPTRDIRDKIKLNRKKLWLIEYGVNKDKIIFSYISKKYFPIYINSTKGIDIANSYNLFSPKYIFTSRLFRSSLVTWCGTSVDEIFKLSHRLNERLILTTKVIKWLKKYNRFKSNQTTNINFRYLNLLQGSIKEIGLQVNLVNLALHKVNQFLKQNSFTLGCGIEDPALSNFTILNNKIALVDLDNYSEDIHLFYEIGFLLTDLEIKYNIPRKVTSKILKTFLTDSEQVNTDYTFYKIGRLCKIFLATLNSSKSSTKNYEGRSFSVLHNILTNELETWKNNQTI